jgi:hypothetical protein
MGCVFGVRLGMRIGFRSDIGNELVRIPGWDYPATLVLRKNAQRRHFPPN